MTDDATDAGKGGEDKATTRKAGAQKSRPPRQAAATGGDAAVDLELAREAILEATLGHVPFDGWTLTSLRVGVRDAGLDESMAVRAFPGGVAELVEYHSAWADQRMLDGLALLDLATMKVRERVAAAVRLRLEQNAPHREAVRRALVFLAQPQHAARALKCLYRTVDAIWYAAGDTATDYNFYTKRALLAGVYSATVVYWLNDKSEGTNATWAFLDRRIGDAMRIPQLVRPLQDVARRLPDPLRLFRTLAYRR